MKAIQEGKLGAYSVGGPAAGQPEYFPLEVCRGEDGALWCGWKPSWKDVWAMVCGHPIRIGLMVIRQPPIIVTMADFDPEYINFCKSCGARKPPIEGEGTCEKCQP